MKKLNLLVSLPGDERARWIALPYSGVGIPSQAKPLLQNGTLSAAVITSLTMDTAIEMLVRSLQNGTQPPELTLVKAFYQPSLEELMQQRG